MLENPPKALILLHMLKKFTLLLSSNGGYNHFHNILRLFDVSPNFPFITSENMQDYYLQT